MLLKRDFVFCLFIGGFVLLSGCGKSDKESCGNGTCESGETATSCAADCSEEAGDVCGDGSCDDGESFAACPADCSGLCTGESDVAFGAGLLGDGAWSATDCMGLVQNSACVSAGMVGAGVTCASAADATTCEAMVDCTWTGGCLASTLITCNIAGATGQTACEAVGCLYGLAGYQSCTPAISEVNCSAGSAVLKAGQGFECSWNATTSQCWGAKTGKDEARAAAAACGASCLAAADVDACVVECMVGEDHLGSETLSSGCLSCYTGELSCVLESCLTECAASTDCDASCSPDCTEALQGCAACQETKGCNALFESCALGTGS
jgi:hypothetical protein